MLLAKSKWILAKNKKEEQKKEETKKEETKNNKINQEPISVS